MPVAELDPAVLRLRDLSSEAVWTLSTCKQGFGIQQLLDRRTTTYWQSDGPQPHMIDIQFLRRTAVHVRRLSDACGRPGWSDRRGTEKSTRFKESRTECHISDNTLRQKRPANEPHLWTRAKGYKAANEDEFCVHKRMNRGARTTFSKCAQAARAKSALPGPITRAHSRFPASARMPPKHNCSPLRCILITRRTKATRRSSFPSAPAARTAISW
jgi:hypothetical protein